MKRKQPATYIHVNRNVIAGNNKHGRNDPAICVKTYKSNTRSKWVRISGVFDVLQADAEAGVPPLSCGAKVYIRLVEGSVTPLA